MQHASVHRTADNFYSGACGDLEPSGWLGTSDYALPTAHHDHALPTPIHCLCLLLSTAYAYPPAGEYAVHLKGVDKPVHTYQEGASFGELALMYHRMSCHRPHRIGLQPPSHRVAASITQGCGHHHIGLQQPPSHRVAASMAVTLGAHSNPQPPFGPTATLWTHSHPLDPRPPFRPTANR